MTTAVWPISVSLGMTMSKSFSTVIADLGDGFEQRISKDQAYSHADAQGGVTSHAGRWEFQVKFSALNRANSDITKEMNQAWAFIIARKGAFESFYVYNQLETPTIDLTGSTTTGRYLVRLKDPIVSFEAFALQLHRGQLTFLEVRA